MTDKDASFVVQAEFTRVVALIGEDGEIDVAHSTSTFDRQKAVALKKKIQEKYGQKYNVSLMGGIYNPVAAFNPKEFYHTRLELKRG